MEDENDSGQISRSDQRSYIKIESLRGKTLTEIDNALHEVCEDSVVQRFPNCGPRTTGGPRVLPLWSS
jgi:hypothetical protein